jgi:hypothetical protein
MAVATLSNVAADLSLSLMQGKYWSTIMTLRDAAGTPIDVTGYVFRGHIRQTAAGALIASFTFTFTITDAPNGTVRVELLSADSAGLTLTRYAYDWEYADGNGEEHALVRGSLSVAPEVTHD